MMNRLSGWRIASETLTADWWRMTAALDAVVTVLLRDLDTYRG